MVIRPSKVIIVDDDESVLTSIARLVASAGHCVDTFDSGQELLKAVLKAPCCIVLDINMPGLNGLLIQDQLIARDPSVPLIFITGGGTIKDGVQAMKAGAIDVLTKPFEATDLLQAIERALAKQQEDQNRKEETTLFRQRLSALSNRERQVFNLVVKGLLNKQIAGELGACEKTIKVHRGRVMRKMRAKSLAELVRLAERTGTIQ